MNVKRDISCEDYLNIHLKLHQKILIFLMNCLDYFLMTVKKTIKKLKRG